MRWRGLVDNIAKHGNGLINPLPSLFDLCVIFGVLGPLFLSPQFHGHYLVFFSIFLFIIGWHSWDRVTRLLDSKWLIGIVLWAFLSVFFHSWGINTTSVAYKWLNFCLMSEGFIYILFGVLLLKTIAEKSRNIRLLYITIPISAIPIIKFYLGHGQISLLTALGISVLVYLFIRKKYKIGLIVTVVSLLVVLVNWNWIWMKWWCRPYAWAQLLREIQQHPFIGGGFNRGLNPDNMMWVNQVGDITVGWLSRHNDYLSISSFIGPVCLIPIIGFLIQLFKRFMRWWFIVPYAAILMLCFVQQTMFDPHKALMILTMMGLFICET